MSDEITNSEEFKQAVADAIAEATEGLKSKNAELLGKLKKAQKDLEAAERERDEWKGKAQSAEKLAKKAATDLDAVTKRAETIDAAYASTLKDSALTEALTKAGVTSGPLLKAAKALLASDVSVADDNGMRVVKAGDKDLASFITEWAGSEDGKHFVIAADAAGGGSQGGHKGASGAKTISRTAFNGLDPGAQAAHFKTGGAVTD
jgi:alanyl-tRNA synthetase